MYLETSALAKLADAFRRGRIADLASVVAAFEEDWLEYSVVAVEMPLIQRAGELADMHRLRAYDAVHLAAAVEGFPLV